MSVTEISLLLIFIICSGTLFLINSRLLETSMLTNIHTHTSLLYLSSTSPQRGCAYEGDFVPFLPTSELALRTCIS